MRLKHASKNPRSVFLEIRNYCLPPLRDVPQTAFYPVLCLQNILQTTFHPLLHLQKLLQITICHISRLQNVLQTTFYPICRLRKLLQRPYERYALNV